MLIYQEDRGSSNSGKKPSGGVLALWAVAGSMNATIANPITFYTGGSIVINQIGQSGDLYNYYFASYSRGTDGQYGSVNWHNLYLDSYIPLRHKSIYDPCPYGYRIPSNGTYNQFTNTGWTMDDYAGGVVWKSGLDVYWHTGHGRRSGYFNETGYRINNSTATIYSKDTNYTVFFSQSSLIWTNDATQFYWGNSVRCIEECEMLTGCESDDVCDQPIKPT